MHTSTSYQVQHPIPLLLSPSHFIFCVLPPLASAVAHNLPLHQLLQYYYYYPVISLLLPEYFIFTFSASYSSCKRLFVLFSSHSLLRESISHHAPSVLKQFQSEKHHYYRSSSPSKKRYPHTQEKRKGSRSGDTYA